MKEEAFPNRSFGAPFEIVNAWLYALEKFLHQYIRETLRQEHGGAKVSRTPFGRNVPQRWNAVLNPLQSLTAT